MTCPHVVTLGGREMTNFWRDMAPELSLGLFLFVMAALMLATFLMTR
jgi:hypothetical protein